MSERQNLPQWRALVPLFASFLGLFAGLCTILALIVTVAEGWKEHVQAQWPEARARVQRCGLDIYPHNPGLYWIDCSLSYEVHGEEIVSDVHSRTTPAPQRVIWRYPEGQFEKLQEWADEHPEGTPITVHYDPANPRNAVLLATNMPLGGARTPANLRVLGGAAASCALLITIGRTMRPKSAARNA